MVNVCDKVLPDICVVGLRCCPCLLPQLNNIATCCLSTKLYSEVILSSRNKDNV